MKVWLVIVLLHMLHFSCGQDCICNTVNETLHDLERRARNYIVAANEPFVSDGNTVYKCYNVGKMKMPTNNTSVKIGSCGTYFPVWMNGTYPGELEGVVNRTACILSYTNYCSTQKIIQVRNCGTYNLYKLRPTSLTSGYCFDTLPDAPDLQDAPKFKPATAAVKHHLTYVDGFIIGTQNVYQKPKLVFSCEFNQSANETLFYKVSWYVNEVEILTKGPTSYAHITDTDLNEDELVDRGHKLDITIKCGVRAIKNVDGFFGNMTTSPGFWVGIQILSPNITIKQGKIGVLQLKSTVPFGCSKDKIHKAPQCLLEVQMYDEHDSYDCEHTSISVIGSQRCAAYIQGSTFENWQDGIFSYEIANMTITTKNKDDYNQDINVFTLALMTPTGTTVNKIMEDNYLGHITVQVEAENAWVRKNCYSRLDPHMWTFDQKYYENQDSPGEFTLYRHKSYKQEVQIKTYLCYKRPTWVPYDITCVCAVSVRAGGEIFIIDVCSNPVLIRHVSCKERLMDVRKIHEYRYEIHMPLGTMVVVSIENWPRVFSSLNIDIVPSVKDVDKTEGLCGILNNDQTDDFTTPSAGMAHNPVEFRDSWRVDISKSLLNPLNHDPGYWEETYYLCVCPGALQTATQPSLASRNGTHPLCSPSVYLSCTKKIEFPGKQYNSCNVKPKRSAFSHSKEIWRILSKREYEKETHYEQHALRKRSTTTYTMEEARRTCEEIFNRSCVAVKFEDIANNTASKESALRDCTLDLNATSDLQLVDIHCSSYSAETERYIRQDSVTKMAHPQEVQAFYASACIHNCNGHGNCINGTCVCHDPYIEKDCSISKADFPAVVDTYNGGFCSRRSDQCCGTIPIYGNRLVEGVTKQKLQKFQVLPNGTTEVLGTVLSDLEILNAFEAAMVVPCEPRKKRLADSQSGNSTVVLAFGVVVSLTNDGINYGSNESYYIYDAECVGYENSSNGYIFNILNEKCYINGVCYSQGEKDPTDSCKECRHATDPYSFSGDCTRSEGKPPSSQQPLIIGTVVGGIILVIVIVIVLVFRMCFKNEKRVCGVSKSETEVQTSVGNIRANTALFGGEGSKKQASFTSENSILGKDATRNERPCSAASVAMNFVESP